MRIKLHFELESKAHLHFITISIQVFRYLIKQQQKHPLSTLNAIDVNIYMKKYSTLSLVFSVCYFQYNSLLHALFYGGKSDFYMNICIDWRMWLETYTFDGICCVFFHIQTKNKTF